MMSDLLHLVWRLIDNVGFTDDTVALDTAAKLRPMLEEFEIQGGIERGERAIVLLREAVEHIDGVTGARERPGSDSGELVARIDAFLKEPE
jgi:hypothetical protein